VEAYVEEEPKPPVVVVRNDLDYWIHEHARLSQKVEKAKETARLRQEWNDPSVGHVFSAGGMGMMTLPPAWHVMADSPLMKEMNHAEKMIVKLGGNLNDVS